MPPSEGMFCVTMSEIWRKLRQNRVTFARALGSISAFGFVAWMGYETFVEKAYANRPTKISIGFLLIFFFPLMIYYGSKAIDVVTDIVAKRK